MKYPGVDYSTPVKFTLRQRIALAIVPRVAGLLVRLMYHTWRKDIRDKHFYDSVVGQGQRAILPIMHETILIAVAHHINTNFHGLTSYSFDGEMAAGFLRALGCEAVRGSSSRGGSEALQAMESALDHIPCVGAAVDGPRGPARVSKPGLIILAARKQLPLIPMLYGASPAWRLRSWDRFVVPKPFARTIAIYGAPIAPPKADTPEAVEETRLQLEAAMNELQSQIDAELGV